MSSNNIVTQSASELVAAAVANSSSNGLQLIATAADSSTSSSAGAASVTTSISSKSGTSCNNDDEIQIVDTPPTTTSIISKATIIDVEITTTAINPVNKCKPANLSKYKGPKTRLQCILGVSVGQLGVNDLRMFATKFNVEGRYKNRSKEKLCESIADVRQTYEERVAKGEEPTDVAKSLLAATTTKTGKDKPPPKAPTSRTRLVNVIYGDKVYPYFKQRGQQLSLQDVANHKQTDQDLFELVAKEYNSSKEEYNIAAFPEKVPLGIPSLPSNYSSTGTWDGLKKEWNDLLREYERQKSNFDVSGAHEQDDADFLRHLQKNPGKDAPSGAIMYLHCFVQQDPNFFDVAVGALNEDVQEESHGPRKKPATASNNLNRNDRKSTAYKALQMKGEYINIRKEEKALLEEKAAKEELHQLTSTISDQQKTKTEYTKELRSSIPDFNDRKERMKAHAARVKERKTNGDTTDFEDTPEEYALEMNNIASCDVVISTCKKRKTEIENKLQNNQSK